MVFCLFLFLWAIFDIASAVPGGGSAASGDNAHTGTKGRRRRHQGPPPQWNGDDSRDGVRFCVNALESVGVRCEDAGVGVGGSL